MEVEEAVSAIMEGSGAEVAWEASVGGALDPSIRGVGAGWVGDIKKVAEVRNGVTWMRRFRRSSGRPLSASLERVRYGGFG